MSSPEVYFTDQRLNAHFHSQLGNLTVKLSALADDLARERFGENALRHPTDISITPAQVETGDYYMVVGFSHQTTGPAPGVLQKHDTSLEIDERGEEIYLECDEGRMSMPLTPREAVFMREVENASLAMLIVDSHNSNN